jgi:hypothetical protein
MGNEKTKILQEKLRYLLTNELKGFRIIDFDLEISGARDEIDEYIVHIEFDYERPMENDMDKIGEDIINISNSLISALSKWTISKDKKLTNYGDVTIFAPAINSMNYVVDTDHIFNVTILVETNHFRKTKPDDREV